MRSSKIIQGGGWVPGKPKTEVCAKGHDFVTDSVVEEVKFTQKRQNAGGEIRARGEFVFKHGNM